METNTLFYFLAAIVPMIVGAIWYNPGVFGKAWMKHSGVTEEMIRGGNMLLIFGLSYGFSLLLAFELSYLVIHQSGFYALFSNELFAGDAAVEAYVNTFTEQYGDKHRHFGHGALHGGMTAILFALPIIGIVGMFERKRWNYVLIHAGYWFVTLTLMGGVLCQFL
jgi:hypothetical protein